MEKDIATLLDAAAFQAADMVGPATVLEGAGRHILDRLDETDPHRWAVTSALGSISAARKSLESAAEELGALVCRKEHGHLGAHCDGEGASWSVGI